MDREEIEKYEVSCICGWKGDYEDLEFSPEDEAMVCPWCGDLTLI